MVKRKVVGNGEKPPNPFFVFPNRSRINANVEIAAESVGIEKLSTEKLLEMFRNPQIRFRFLPIEALSTDIQRIVSIVAESVGIEKLSTEKLLEMFRNPQIQCRFWAIVASSTKSLRNR